MKTRGRKVNVADDKVSAGELLSMEEAIALLKTTRPTFYRWMRSGKLRGMKVGRQWRFYRESIEGFLKGEQLRYDLPVGVEPLVAALRQRLGEKGVAVATLSDAEKVALVVDLVIRAAITAKASDIHLDIAQGRGRLRYRINGVLKVACEFDARLLPSLVARLKAMGNCDVNIRTLPQDARFPFRTGDTDIDLLVGFLPALGGEILTIRLLDRSVSRFSLEQLMPDAPTRETLVRALNATSGMVIVSGPVGSGKTITLYACVNYLASPNRKVISIEDPVEYTLPDVVQVAVNKREGLTASAALRAVLRSDPNVVVIGELKDAESADLALKAAMSGRLVLTAMFAHDTAHVLTRLQDLGCASHQLADALRIVTSQRLVRKLCTKCRVKDEPEKELLQWAEQAAAEGGLDWKSLPRRFMKAAGCPECSLSGFRRRAMAMEMIDVNREMAKAIRTESPEDVRVRAVRQGIRTQAAAAVRLACEGVTSLQEAMVMTE